MSALLNSFGFPDATAGSCTQLCPSALRCDTPIVSAGLLFWIATWKNTTHGTPPTTVIRGNAAS